MILDTQQSAQHLQMWHNTGFILRLHQDLKMKTIGNGEDITWIHLFNQVRNR